MIYWNGTAMNMKFCLVAALVASTVSPKPAWSQHLMQNGDFAATADNQGAPFVVLVNPATLDTKG